MLQAHVVTSFPVKKTNSYKPQKKPHPKRATPLPYEEILWMDMIDKQMLKFLTVLPTSPYPGDYPQFTACFISVEEKTGFAL